MNKFSIFNFQFSINEAGFSLIELLVAVSIIGVLSALLLSNMQGTRERARDAQRKNDLYQVKQALRMYYNDNQEYPAADSGNIGDDACDGGACTWGTSVFGTTGAPYIKKLPKDPVGTDYYYEQTSDDAFNLSACLENKSDSSGEDCPVGYTACTNDWCFTVSE